VIRFDRLVQCGENQVMTRQIQQAIEFFALELTRLVINDHFGEFDIAHFGNFDQIHKIHSKVSIRFSFEKSLFL